MCRKHYVHWYRRRPDGPACVAQGCTSPAYSSGHCARHWSAWKKYGDAGAIDRKRAIARKVDSNGYVLIRVPGHPAATGGGGWVLEHRVVMERHLGRFLERFENIHHKNGVRDDNRPENLEMWITRQPAGQRPEDLVEYAHWIIARYGQRSS